jgi:hypothetical protein
MCRTCFMSIYSSRLPLTSGVHAGVPVRSFLEPTTTLAPGTLVYFQPQRLKHDPDPPGFAVPYGVDATNPVHALAEYLRACQVSGQPIQNFLARVMAPDRRRFLEKCMTSGQLTTRLRSHFQAVGVQYPVTTHGGRRGAIQALTQEGLASAAVGEMAQIRTPGVRICYQDERRHLPCGVPRVGKCGKRKARDSF